MDGLADRQVPAMKTHCLLHCLVLKLEFHYFTIESLEITESRPSD